MDNFILEQYDGSMDYQVRIFISEQMKFHDYCGDCYTRGCTYVVKKEFTFRCSHPRRGLLKKDEHVMHQDFREYKHGMWVCPLCSIVGAVDSPKEKVFLNTTDQFDWRKQRHEMLKDGLLEAVAVTEMSHDPSLKECQVVCLSEDMKCIDTCKRLADLRTTNVRRPVCDFHAVKKILFFYTFFLQFTQVEALDLSNSLWCVSYFLWAFSAILALVYIYTRVPNDERRRKSDILRFHGISVYVSDTNETVDYKFSKLCKDLVGNCDKLFTARMANDYWDSIKPVNLSNQSQKTVKSSGRSPASRGLRLPTAMEVAVVGSACLPVVESADVQTVYDTVAPYFWIYMMLVGLFVLTRLAMAFIKLLENLEKVEVITPMKNAITQVANEVRLYFEKILSLFEKHSNDTLTIQKMNVGVTAGIGLVGVAMKYFKPASNPFLFKSQGKFADKLKEGTSILSILMGTLMFALVPILGVAVATGKCKKWLTLLKESSYVCWFINVVESWWSSGEIKIPENPHSSGTKEWQEWKDNLAAADPQWRWKPKESSSSSSHSSSSSSVEEMNKKGQEDAKKAEASSKTTTFTSGWFDAENAEWKGKNLAKLPFSKINWDFVGWKNWNGVEPKGISHSFKMWCAEKEPWFVDVRDHLELIDGDSEQLFENMGNNKHVNLLEAYDYTQIWNCVVEHVIEGKPVDVSPRDEQLLCHYTTALVQYLYLSKSDVPVDIGHWVWACVNLRHDEIDQITRCYALHMRDHFVELKKEKTNHCEFLMRAGMKHHLWDDFEIKAFPEVGKAGLGTPKRDKANNVLNENLGHLGLVYGKEANRVPGEVIKSDKVNNSRFTTFVAAVDSPVKRRMILMDEEIDHNNTDPEYWSKLNEKYNDDKIIEAKAQNGAFFGFNLFLAYVYGTIIDTTSYWYTQWKMPSGCTWDEEKALRAANASALAEKVPFDTFWKGVAVVYGSLITIGVAWKIKQFCDDGEVIETDMERPLADNEARGVRAGGGKEYFKKLYSNAEPHNDLWAKQFQEDTLDNDDTAVDELTGQNDVYVGRRAARKGLNFRFQCLEAVKLSRRKPQYKDTRNELRKKLKLAHAATERMNKPSGNVKIRHNGVIKEWSNAAVHDTNIIHDSVQLELQKTIVNSPREYNAQAENLYSFSLQLVDGTKHFIMNAFKIANKFVLCEHAFSDYEDIVKAQGGMEPEYLIHKDGTEYKFKQKEFVPGLALDLGYFPFNVPLNLPRVNLRTPRDGEPCVIVARDEKIKDGAFPLMDTGICNSQGYYTCGTKEGFCGAPVISVIDGSILGIHQAGSSIGNYFCPMSAEVIEKLRAPLLPKRQLF